jgi:hypothetical protein
LAIIASDGVGPFGANDSLIPRLLSPKIRALVAPIREALRRAMAADKLTALALAQKRVTSATPRRAWVAISNAF